jgi:starch synthase (maltosyl-transferring)
VVRDKTAAETKKRTTAKSGAKASKKGGKHPADPRLEALAAQRIAIEGVNVEIDGGRFPARAVAGQPERIAVDIFCDGHDTIEAALLYRHDSEGAFTEVALEHLGNDRWEAWVTFSEIGNHELTFIAWRNLFATWRKDVAKKHAAGRSVGLELEEARHMIEAAYGREGRANAHDKTALRDVIKADREAQKVGMSDGERLARLTSAEVAELMDRAGPRTNLSDYKVLPLYVDRRAAAFSAWYELMPRSQSGDLNRHGTFDDVIARLGYVRDLGFDVLYFPPIHPIGRTNRKGKNNSLTAGKASPAAPMPSARRRAGTMRSTPSWARSTISTAW